MSHADHQGDREVREWWVVHDGTVQRATGLSCAPENPDVWWFPSLGYSKTRGFHVFADQHVAIDTCRRELERAIAGLQQQLARLPKP